MPIQLLAEKFRAILSFLNLSRDHDTSPDTENNKTQGDRSTPDTDTASTTSSITDTSTIADIVEDTEDTTDVAGTEDDETVDDDVYETQAEDVAGAIIDEFTPDTALHIGCGAGHHMKPFLDAGIDTHGIDPSSVAHENAVVPTDRIEIYDLGYQYTPNDTYDLVVCLDTLEYVAERHADIIIRSISASGSTAVISIPDAPHRPDPEDWIDKFASQGMEFDADTTERLTDTLPSSDVLWAPDRVLVFRQ